VLIQQTIEKLHDLGLKTMAEALVNQMDRGEASSLTFDERLGLIVDREWIHRQNARIDRRVKAAHLKIQPSAEDIDYRHPRGLDRGVMQDLVSCRWIRAKGNLILCGPTGLGKTWIANALAHKACQEGFTAYYARVPRLVNELAIARTDGTYLKVLGRLAKFDLLILDDWALSPLEGEAMHSILEVIDDRAGFRSTVLTSQLPVGKWHGMVGDPSVADALLDRVLGAAIQINLKGESMRPRLPTV
jgi:DNA replication protein DnaC